MCKSGAIISNRFYIFSLQNIFFYDTLGSLLKYNPRTIMRGFIWRQAKYPRSRSENERIIILGL